jgi:hypothetical protein
MSSACFTTQFDWSASGGKAREQRDVRLHVALADDRGLVGHAQQERRQSGEVERVVLHVGIDEVHGRPRGFAGVDDRQIPGVDEPIDRLSGGQLGHDRVQMDARLLRGRHCDGASRQDYREGKNRKMSHGGEY